MDDYRANVIDITELSLDSGFVLYPVKSVSEPIDTDFADLGLISITAYLTPEEVGKLSTVCQEFFKKKFLTIRNVAELVGQMVARLPGLEDDRLYYRLLDNEKSRALVQSKGNFDAKMGLTELAKQDVVWWIENVQTAYTLISDGNPTIILQSGACTTGWGGIYGHQPAGGNWSDGEA